MADDRESRLRAQLATARAQIVALELRLRESESERRRLTNLARVMLDRPAPRGPRP